MKTNLHIKLIALAASAVLCASAARADDVLKLNNGTVLHGRATAYDDATRVVTFVTQDGGERKLPIGDLDRLSAYKIAKSRAPETNGPGQLRIGNIARDAELYRYALQHYANARKADPKLGAEIDKEMVTLRREAADYCMRNAKAAVAKNDTAGAEKWLKTLVEKLPNEAPAAEATSMLDNFFAKNHSAKMQEVETSTPDQIKADLALGKKAYDSMLENVRKGLTNARTTSAARNAYEEAWHDGERALRELGQVQKKYTDADSTKLLGGYRDVVTQHMVDSQLSLASLLSTSTNYNGAQEAINKALSLDPKNQAALEARARTELAASQSSVFGWR